MEALASRVIGFNKIVMLVALGGLSTALAGCSSGPTTLTLHPEASTGAYAQTFNQAYCGKTKDGSYNCVLVADDSPSADKVSDAPSKGPIEPGQRQPLRQVVHVRVLWRPMNGMRDSMAANATIDWYIMNNTADGGDDLLLYQGSGYVMVSPDDKTTKITIRNAEMKPALVKGHLSDPIGNAKLSGTFVAINDNQQTADLAGAARQRTASIASGQ